MSTSTSSGAHPFRPQCLVDAYVTQMLDEWEGDPAHAMEITLEEVPTLLALIYRRRPLPALCRPLREGRDTQWLPDHRVSVGPSLHGLW